MHIQADVKQALQAGGPVVALESTIITHGMPYPQNVETALAVEAAVRSAGAVPATIAILDGKLKVGLSTAEIEHLAKAEHVVKTSRRDLPVVVANKLNGATTVAGTMIVAAMAGIRVFVTGGIGGVHRGAEKSWDVSADLSELAKTDVAVVCAGAKSILDIGLTLEYLETQGVPVLGYQTEDFPAFYVRESGFKVLHRAESPEEVARILRAKWNLGLHGGAVVANPIPEAAALPGAEIERAIVEAVAEAERQGIGGKALTPFLLSRLNETTEGRALQANMALVKHNAEVGAAIAVALSDGLREHVQVISKI